MFSSCRHFIPALQSASRPSPFGVAPQALTPIPGCNSRAAKRKSTEPENIYRHGGAVPVTGPGFQLETECEMGHLPEKLVTVRH